jgi:adenosylcobinamide kinase / adenosylcobinamide-phosphate guanylyltransferase
MLELILGGARSGKSALAVKRAVASACPVIFIATAQPGDEEMRERIERHRRERPAEWITYEEPVRLAAALRTITPGAFLVIDCLTLWIANVLFPIAHAAAPGVDEAGWLREREQLLQALRELSADAVLVSNELGLGLVPETPVGRRFRDEQGRLNQQLAALCDRVTFVAAGLPLTLKPER